MKKMDREMKRWKVSWKDEKWDEERDDEMKSEMKRWRGLKMFQSKSIIISFWGLQKSKFSWIFEIGKIV